MKNDAATVRPVRLRVGIRWAGVRKSSFFSRNMINFVLKLTNFVLQLLNSGARSVRPRAPRSGGTANCNINANCFPDFFY